MLTPRDHTIASNFIKNGATITWELNGSANRSFTTAASGTLTRNDSWNVWSARSVDDNKSDGVELFDEVGLSSKGE